MFRRLYLYSDLVKNGKCLKAEDGHYLLCDGDNHYHVYPQCDIKPIEGCWCTFAQEIGSRPAGATFRLNHQKLARPRYEVYNKDSDFFHDHETGAMIWLQLSSSPQKGGECYVELLVTEILELLNRKENGTVLLSHQPRPAQQGQAGTDHKRSVQG